MSAIAKLRGRGGYSNVSGEQRPALQRQQRFTTKHITIGDNYGTKISNQAGEVG